MTAFASITLPDHTPANVVFVPNAIDSNGVARYYENAQSIIDARRTLSCSVRLPVKGSQVARVQIKIGIPVMDTTDTLLKVGEALFTGEFVLPKKSSANQRADLWYFAQEYIAHASILAAVSNMESIY